MVKEQEKKFVFWTEEKKKSYAAAIRLVINEIYKMDAGYYMKNGSHFIRFIEHRLKTTESILSKLERKHKHAEKPVEELLNDIAGVRVICFDTKQIDRLVKQIRKSEVFVVKKEKDYIKNPKDNGYQSYHMILEVNGVKVELQIRTILMDAWASLESTLVYKKEKSVSKKMKEDIISFSKWSKKMDKLLERMLEEELTPREKEELKQNLDNPVICIRLEEY